MSKRYYENLKKHQSKAYKIGARFEYATMRFLRLRGFHCNRRFGSIGVLFCPKCMRELKRPKKGSKSLCPKCKIQGVKASLDVTAYKNGQYLMITCKFRSDRMSTYMDDSTWQNMVLYASKFNAIPLFAGVTENRKLYFTDLRTLMKFDTFHTPDSFYRYKDKDKPHSDIQRLIDHAWSIMDLADEYIGANAPDKCKVCKQRARWAEVKVKMINILNRVLWRAGKTESEDDLTTLFEEIEGEEKT